MQTERHVIAALNQTRNQLSILQPEDKDTIIQAGASLEAVIHEIPENCRSAIEAVTLCLHALQTIYQGGYADFEKLLKAVTANLVAVEQALGAPPNPISEMLLKQGEQKLKAELENKSTAAENVKAIEKAKVLTLNDIASWLVQTEAEDKTEIAAICEAIKKISAEEKVVEKRKLLVKSARELTRIVNGKTSDAFETFNLVGELIDQVNSADEPAEISVNSIQEKAQAVVSDPETAELQNEIPAEKSVKTNENSKATAVSGEKLEGDILASDMDAGLVSEFVMESREMLEAGESALLALETDPNDIENVNTVFRAFHTIKGTAAYLGLKRLTELAHHAESLLSRIRDREINCTGGYANLALRSLDVLKEMLDAVEGAKVETAMSLPAGYGNLLAILKDPEANGVDGKTDFQPAVSANSETVKVQKEEVAEAVEEGKADERTEAYEPSKAAEFSKEIAVLREEDAENLLNQEKSQTKKAAASGSDSSVRVRTDRLDRLIDMVGELVIAQSMLAQDATVVQGIHHELSRKISHAGKIVRELQDLSMGMRMIPLKNTFQKMARLVRDVAKKCGKQVEFVTEGEDTEIDRNMVDFISDPLVHMVRNAVDHGIERPGIRQEKGKSAMGTVRLSAYHAGGDVVVELTDDGAGLDAEKLVAKAIAKNLIESDKGMSESEIFKLIFAPGFSTAEILTDVSGRGVGMDVVRRNIEAMRGRIEINSEKGKGSVFTIRLPLTLAITDGMLIRVGAEKYIVPTVNIQMSFQPNQKMLSSVNGRGELVSLRGELMPIFRVHELFDVQNAIEDPTKGLLMIVADGRRRCALLVDELLGQQQVVTKTLGQGIGKINGVSGGAILGDGCVGLILDTAEIVALARQNTSAVDRKEDLIQQAA
ncbi:MAG: chemotaxis protein CheA [Pyrinomonadaceae bacterium]|nr:chemotaxis protein CheA [Pyrinomonadaceae bacterium]